MDPRSSTLDPYEKLQDRISISRMIIILVFLGSMIVFEKYSIPILLIGLNALLVSRMQRYRLELLGIELSSITTVLTGYVYGPVAGAVIGLTSVLVTSAASFSFGPFLAWKFPGIMLLGVMPSLLDGGLVRVGTISTAAIRSAFIILAFRFTPSVAPNSLVYELSAIGFTSGLLIGLGETLLTLF